MSKKNKVYNNLIHVYAPRYWHDDAFIVANSAGLKTLKLAIDRALSNGESKAEVFAADGEEYDIVVISLEDRQKWDRLAEPYTEEYARETREEVLWPEKLVTDNLHCKY